MWIQEDLLCRKKDEKTKAILKSLLEKTTKRKYDDPEAKFDAGSLASGLFRFSQIVKDEPLQIYKFEKVESLKKDAPYKFKKDFATLQDILEPPKKDAPKKSVFDQFSGFKK